MSNTSKIKDIIIASVISSCVSFIFMIFIIKNNTPIYDETDMQRIKEIEKSIESFREIHSKCDSLKYELQNIK